MITAIISSFSNKPNSAKASIAFITDSTKPREPTDPTELTEITDDIVSLTSNNLDVHKNSENKQRLFLVFVTVS